MAAMIQMEAGGSWWRLRRLRLQVVVTLDHPFMSPKKAKVRVNGKTSTGLVSSGNSFCGAC